MHKRQPKTVVPSIDVSQLQLLEVSEVAKLLSVGRSTVYVLISNGELQGVRVGRAGVRVPVVAVQQYIKEQSIQAS